MVCLKASEEEMEQLMSGLDHAAFYDSDLPHMKHTAVSFRPITRENGREIFGHLSLA
jgi:hypothetical protein